MKKRAFIVPLAASVAALAGGATQPAQASVEPNSIDQKPANLPNTASSTGSGLVLDRAAPGGIVTAYHSSHSSHDSHSSHSSGGY